MKKKKSKGIKKQRGASTSLLLSIGVHILLFVLAGMLVVFTVVKKEEQVFEPPQRTERPKMKLKKPKVKVKKASKPKSASRIIANTPRTVMPNIDLPELGGMGTGLGDGIDGFDVMPDLADTSVFGAGQSIGNDFEGTFYDFKRARSGREIAMDDGTFTDKMAQFVRSGWDASVLAPYYRSPKKLYATSIMVPPTKSMFAPGAFGESCEGWAWMVHYKGTLVYPEDIKFRFWGYGDDLLMVRVNGRMVLNANYHQNGTNTEITNIGGRWDSSAPEDSMYWYGTGKARVGDWIDLKAGQPFDMEVVIGEVPGGEFCSMLTVQVDGVEYERNRQGAPILPMFMTEVPTRRLQDIVLRDLVQGEASATNFFPVFRDYQVTENPGTDEEGNEELAVAEEPAKTDWTTRDGNVLKGEYLSEVAGNVILETADGAHVKVPVDQLAAEDQEYLELLNPPEFSINFVKQSFTRPGRYVLSTKEMGWGKTLPRVNDWKFGAKAIQRGIGNYNHELTLEYFAVGQELLGDQYVLLDRQARTFVPTEEPDASFEFKGEPSEFIEYDFEGQMRGNRPTDNVVILTDKQGKVIEYYASKSWMWEHIDNLRKLPVQAYFDKTCSRAYPTSPKPTKW